MLDTVIDALATRLGIDHALARQCLAMALEALHENDEGELAGELEQRIGDLGNVEATGSGGGGFGLIGEAAGLVSGTPDSGAHGLKALLGGAAGPFADALAGVIGSETDAALGQRLGDVLKRVL
ncbi:MAG: hypothetical protein KDC18_10455 [Alphaproteobacteria bacterium]|nr:hypothetical protein [Alphaproteobacteria bacterium]MCB9929975.1 hypothetical protein [Alphaproteobacteria bacterium]